MNTIEFQSLCREIRERCENGQMTDQDVDLLADAVSNVLGRDDLRADGTEYSLLYDVIAEKYGFPTGQDALVARAFEVFRMNELFRPHPIEDVVSDEGGADDAGSYASMKYPGAMKVESGGRVVALCRWGDIGGCHRLVGKAAEFVEALHDEDEANATSVYDALVAIGARTDSLDEQEVVSAKELVGADGIVSAERPFGTIWIGEGGMDRAGALPGAELVIDMDNRKISVDCFTIYGKKFYREISGIPDGVPIDLPTMTSEDVVFSFERSGAIAADWENRLSGGFYVSEDERNLIGVCLPLMN